MSKLTDHELIEELQYRFAQNKKSLEELSTLTRQLQLVNKKLKESEKLKSQFLSNIRNEMNNPLASILGLCKNIQFINPEHWERTKSMAALIHTEAFSLDFQLKNIFAAAELESGEQVLEVVEVDIALLLNNVVSMYGHQLKAKQITIKNVGLFTDQQEKRFKTDPAKLQLIISNLIANAIEYSHPQKEIILKVWIQQNMLHIAIQDFGTGIEKADQNAIFNRFTQLNCGITKSHRGHGLGLSVTKALVELLSGQIEVKSIATEGSTFIISIQASEADTAYFTSDGNDIFFNEGELF